MTQFTITPENIGPVVDKFYDENGVFDLVVLFRQLKEKYPTIATQFNTFSKIAREYASSKGYQSAKIIHMSRSPSISRSSTMEFDKIPAEFEPLLPRYSFDSVGGLSEQKERILDLILVPLQYQPLFDSVGVPPPRGILLHGPSGCGKTLFGEAAAGEIQKIVPNLKYFYLAATELLGPQPDVKLRSLFKAATTFAPSIVFIDEIDIIFAKKDRLLVTQLSNLLESAFQDPKGIFVLGATSRIDKIDTTLRCQGKFSTEISLGIPDYNQRFSILQVVTKGIPIQADSDWLVRIAREAEGYVGADLQTLVSEASLIAAKRIVEENLHDALILESDFRSALKVVQPSLRREGFTSLNNASFDDIGGLDDVKAELYSSIIQAISHPELYESYGFQPAVGAILYGPPGCGKTLLARAIAHEADRAAFISVKGPELLNKYLGESESAVRAVFRRASDSAPCIIFFDEIDALCPKRSDDSSNAASSRVVNQLLTEMDGVVGRGRVFVIGATNRIELIDDAMLRPGRLDKIIEVPLPDFAGRVDIFKKHISKIKLLGEDIDVEFLAKESDGFSGADIEGVVTEAIEEAIKLSRDGNWVPVSQELLMMALAKIIEAKVASGSSK